MSAAHNLELMRKTRSAMQVVRAFCSSISGPILLTASHLPDRTRVRWNGKIEHGMAHRISQGRGSFKEGLPYVFVDADGPEEE